MTVPRDCERTRTHRSLTINASRTGSLRSLWNMSATSSAADISVVTAARKSLTGRARPCAAPSTSRAHRCAICLVA
jgi:hypothetical protein